MIKYHNEIKERIHLFNAYISEKYQKLQKKEQFAVWLTLIAAICGLFFALADPHLVWYRRIARASVDILLLFGIYAYVSAAGNPDTLIPKKNRRIMTWIRNIERFILIIFTTAATIFIAVSTDIDPYIRGYRLSLSIILILAVIGNIRKPIPNKFFIKFFALQIIFTVLEAVTLLYVGWTVDGPIIYKALQNGTQILVKNLNTTGFNTNPAVGTLIINQSKILFEYRNNKIYGTDLFKDATHWTHDDPINAVKTLFETAWNYNKFIVFQRFDRVPIKKRCLAFSIINPPLDGYRLTADKALANGLSLTCAIALNNVTDEENIYKNLNDWILTRKKELNKSKKEKKCDLSWQEIRRIQTMFASLSIFNEIEVENYRQRLINIFVTSDSKIEYKLKNEQKIALALLDNLDNTCRNHQIVLTSQIKDIKKRRIAQKEIIRSAKEITAIKD